MTHSADPTRPEVIPLPAAEEKQKILDLFKN
jgi:hypothetical protein